MTPDHEGRRAAVRAAVADAAPEADALLVTDLVNVRYLTGFTGSNAVLLLPREGEPLLGTDGRYVTQCAEQCPDLPLLVDRATATAVAARAATDGLAGLAVEAEHVSLAAGEDLAAALGDGGRLTPTRGVVEGLRAVKDDSEIDLLRRACAITDAALAALQAEARAGWSERQVARRLEWLMYEMGADAISFETIVAAGPNSAVPHHEPSGRPLAPGDLVVIDFGAAVGGYHADETRTFVVGESPADWQREIHGLTRQAQAAGRAALHGGVETLAVDTATRRVIEDAGHGEHFGHGTGHGVGLQIHEAPMIGPRSTGRIAARTPVTVEPGVYLPGRGGVRIEDTVLVTADGAESLTTTARELLVLG